MLAKTGFCVCHGGLSSDLIRGAAQEAQWFFESGRMGSGQTVVGDRYADDPHATGQNEFRGDVTLWMSRGEPRRLHPEEARRRSAGKQVAGSGLCRAELSKTITLENGHFGVLWC